MTDMGRVIVPGVWKDCFIGEHDYPNAYLKTGLVNAAGKSIDVQNPLPTDGDSVYQKDIWAEESLTTDWIDIDGAGIDLIYIPVSNLHTRIQNSTNSPIKSILMHFNRTLLSSSVGFGCTGGGDFSNIKISLIGSGSEERSLVDDSLNDIKYTSKVYNFTKQLFNAVLIEFYTTEPVCISNITIQKTNSVSISQVDTYTDSVITIDNSHAELHAGDHYFYADTHSLTKNGVQDHMVVTPDTEELAHFVIGVETITSSILIAIYEGPTYSDPGALEPMINRNRNFGEDNTTLLYEDPVLISTGLRLTRKTLGAGKNSNGGAARDTEEIVLRRNTAYLIRVTEQNVASTVVNLNFDWYEHTSKNLI